MNSDEDYYPPRVSPSGPRRSKRVTRSDKNFKLPKSIKEKAPRKNTAKTSGTPAKKAKPSPEDDKPSNSFDGSALTGEELAELWNKFNRDGHFRVNPQNKSPAPLVVSRITDGKVVTTRIECYKPEKNLMRDLTATITSPKPDDRKRPRLDDSDDPRAVVFSNPIPETSGKTLNVNTTSGLFSSAQDTSKGVKKTINFNEISPDSGSHLHQTFDVANGLPNITGSSPMQPESFSSVSNSRTNIPEIPSNSTAFSFVDSAASQSPPTHCNPAFLCSNANTWNPPKPNTTFVENHQIPNTYSLYFPNNNIPQNESDSSVAKRFDSFDFNDDRYGNLNPSSLQTINNQQNRATSFNSDNSSFLSSNQSSVGNSSNDWNSSELTSLNTFPANDPLTISSNSLNGLSDDSINFILPIISAYNPEIGTNNHRVYAMPMNTANGFNGNSSNANGYNISSFTSWNGGPMFPSNLTTGNGSPYCNMYSVQNSAGFYDTSGTRIINEQNYQMNSWPQNQQVNDGFLLVNDNGGSDFPTMTPNLSNNEHAMNINDLPVLTNIEDEVIIPDNEEPIEGPSVFENFTDIHDVFDPNKLSTCAYYDDITYSRFTDQNLNCNKENSVTAAQNNRSIVDFLMSAGNEAKPLHDGGNNYSKFTSESLITSTNSVFYDFDTKKDVTRSSEC